MNGFRLFKSNFGEISPTLHKIAVRNFGNGQRNSGTAVHNSIRVTQNGRILEKSTYNYITGKSLCSFSRTFRHTEEIGRSNVHIPILHVPTSRCLCTAHDGFCLSFEEFRSLIQSKDIQIIDVREPDEIEQEGSIPNAVNIPLGTLKKALKMEDDLYMQKYKFPKPEKYDANIVFVGLGPIKSSAARAIAYNHGYKYSRHYGGGYSEWSERMKSQTE